MTSTSPERSSALDALAADLRQNHPGLVTELSVLPSGAVFLDVRRGDRAWVLDYSPTHDQYGVDELGELDGFTTSYRYATPNLDAAAQILRNLVSRA